MGRWLDGDNNVSLVLTRRTTIRTTTTIRELVRRPDAYEWSSGSPGAESNCPDSGAVKTLRRRSAYRAASRWRAYGAESSERSGCFSAVRSSAREQSAQSVDGSGRRRPLLFGLFFSTLMAYVIGAYLACVEAALDAQDAAPSVLDAIGHYFSECIGTMFWMWIGGMLLGFVLAGWVGMAVSSSPCSSTRSRSSLADAGAASSRKVLAGSGRTGPVVRDVGGSPRCWFPPCRRRVRGWLDELQHPRHGRVGGPVDRRRREDRLSGAWRSKRLVPLVVHAVMVFRGASFAASIAGTAGAAPGRPASTTRTAARGLGFLRQ